MASKAEVVQLRQEMKQLQTDLENEKQAARESVSKTPALEDVDSAHTEELIKQLQIVELENEELITSLERLKYEQLEVETLRLETQMLREAYVRGSSRTDKLVEETAGELRDLKIAYANLEQEMEKSKEAEIAAQNLCQELESQLTNTTQVLEQSEAEVERLAPFEGYSKSLELQKIALERDLGVIESRFQQATQDILSQRKQIEAAEEQILMLKKKVLLASAASSDG